MQNLNMCKLLYKWYENNRHVSYKFLHHFFIRGISRYRNFVHFGYRQVTDTRHIIKLNSASWYRISCIKLERSSDFYKGAYTVNLGQAERPRKGIFIHFYFLFWLDRKQSLFDLILTLSDTIYALFQLQPSLRYCMKFSI